MASQTQPMLITNGRFFSTANGKDPVFHDTIFIQNGTIQHIGARSDLEIAAVEKELGENLETKDLGGRIVLPGFIDGHMHFLLLGQSLQKLDLDGSKDISEIRERISKFAKENPDAQRILCRGWMHSMTDGKALASMLDDLDPRPIFIDSKDLHSTWCNTAGLHEMGVQDMPNPVGGTIERDENGKVSGLLSEAAVLTISWPHLARVASMPEKIAALRAAVQAYNAAGYTGMIDMALDENGWEAVQAFKAADGVLSVRLAAHWLITPSGTEAERLAQVQRAIDLNKDFNDRTSPDLRVVGIKVICDGVIDACTAALLEPYSNNTSASLDPLWSKEMLDPVVKKADQAGLQVALHAIGDGAVNLAINALEQNCSPGRRHRIEHLELTSPEDALRLGKLGITASIQPVHSDPAILRAWPSLLGPKRLKRAFAYKEFLDGGAVLAIGSDSPTAPYAPIPNLYVATTRKSARDLVTGDAPVNVNFRLGLCEAISGAIKGSAYSCFAEGRVGTLEKGKMADFVVVDMEFKEEKLLEARVRETWFGGKKVFESEAL